MEMIRIAVWMMAFSYAHFCSMPASKAVCRHFLLWQFRVVPYFSRLYLVFFAHTGDGLLRLQRGQFAKRGIPMTLHFSQFHEGTNMESSKRTGSIVLCGSNIFGRRFAFASMCDILGRFSIVLMVYTNASSYFSR